MVAEPRRAQPKPYHPQLMMLPIFTDRACRRSFVDVANLLYLRVLRMTVDFGKLLDFLRGHRRLISTGTTAPPVHKWATSRCLAGGQRLGYRITTRRITRPSSGAKKADLDPILRDAALQMVERLIVLCS